MTTKRPRANVTFAPARFAALNDSAEASGLSLSHIVDQLVSAHMQELIEHAAWMKKQKGDLRTRGAHALEQYGPNDLISEIKNLDPTYQAPAALQMTAGANMLSAEEVAELRTLLAKSKDTIK